MFHVDLVDLIDSSGQRIVRETVEISLNILFSNYGAFESRLVLDRGGMVKASLDLVNLFFRYNFLLLL